jgi:hypothetical protein
MTYSTGQSAYLVGLYCSAALVLGGLSYFTPFLDTFFWVPILMPCHELGHAIADWLSGKTAVPTVFFTVSGEEKTPFVYLPVAAALLCTLYFTYRARHTCACIAVTAVLGGQIYLSFVASKQVQRQVELMGGLAGECLLAPLLTWLAFVNLGSIWRKYRLGLAAWAAIALGSRVAFWGAVVTGLGELPHGAFVMGEEMGDTNQLIDTFGWSAQHLIWIFSAIALCSVWLTSAIVTVEYLRGLPSSDTSKKSSGLDF